VAVSLSGIYFKIFSFLRPQSIQAAKQNKTAQRRAFCVKRIAKQKSEQDFLEFDGRDSLHVDFNIPDDLRAFVHRDLVGRDIADDDASFWMKTFVKDELPFTLPSMDALLPVMSPRLPCPCRW
jgi:hypothetical protein